MSFCTVRFLIISFSLIEVTRGSVSMTFTCSISDLLKSFSSLVLTAFAAVNSERCSASSCCLRLGCSCAYCWLLLFCLLMAMLFYDSSDRRCSPCSRSLLLTCRLFATSLAVSYFVIGNCFEVRLVHLQRHCSAFATSRSSVRGRCSGTSAL